MQVPTAPPSPAEARRGSGGARFLPRWLAGTLVVLAVAAVAATLFLAVVHVDDRYRIDHVSGARMVLAQRASDGVLYPELYDGTSYGGTRFMPLPIVLHAGLAQATGEYLVSGKLLSGIAAAALVVVTFVVLRRERCPTSLALALSVVVFVTDAGLSAVMDMRADILATALQLAAVGLVASRFDTAGRSWLGAAALAALAVVVKTSAVWAPIAIVAWFAVGRRWRQAASFVVAYLVAALALVGAFAVWSDGRLFENVVGLASAGVTGLRSVALAPYRWFHLAVGEAAAGWALLPLAFVALTIVVRTRVASVHAFAFVASVLLSVAVLVDVGTGRNQLLDPIVLGGVMVGSLAGRSADGAPAAYGAGGIAPADVPAAAARRDSVLVLAAGLTAAWVLVSGLTVTSAPDLATTIRGEAAYPAEPLDDLIGPETTLLSEDPYVPLAHGRKPVILDAFMLPRIAETRPGAVEDLIDRIEAREFDLIVLLEAVEPVDRTWWAQIDLGVPVVRAIERSYAFREARDGYFLYTPAEH